MERKKKEEKKKIFLYIYIHIHNINTYNTKKEINSEISYIPTNKDEIV